MRKSVQEGGADQDMGRRREGKEIVKLQPWESTPASDTL